MPVYWEKWLTWNIWIPGYDAAALEVWHIPVPPVIGWEQGGKDKPYWCQYTQTHGHKTHALSMVRLATSFSPLHSAHDDCTNILLTKQVQVVNRQGSCVLGVCVNHTPRDSSSPPLSANHRRMPHFQCVYMISGYLFYKHTARSVSCLPAVNLPYYLPPQAKKS